MDALLALLRRARAEAERGEARAALTTLGMALRLDGESASVWHEIGVVLTYVGDYDDAIAAFDESIRLNPHRASSYFQKGLLLTELDRESEARQAFGLAVELTPDFEEVAAEFGEVAPESGLRSTGTLPLTVMESARKRSA